MKIQEALAALEAAGTAQNRKVYARHGYPPDRTFGVSFTYLAKLSKQAGVDHDLATKLWASHNGDAQILACQIADPSRATSRELDQWASQVDFYPLADAFSKFVGTTRYAQPKIKQWTASKSDFTGQAGWNLLSLLALNDPEPPDTFFTPYLKRIESGIHKAPNRTRHAMNQTLIAIGTRNPKLTEAALRIAAKIGKVEVDHGETSCTTPDAAAYIQKTLARRAKKLAEQQVRSKGPTQKGPVKRPAAQKRLRTRPRP